MLFTAHNLAFIPGRWCRWVRAEGGPRGLVLAMMVGILFPAHGQLDRLSPSIRIATRQFQTPGEGAYLELQVEFLASSLDWLAGADSSVRAGVQWTAVALDGEGAIAGFAKSTARTGDLDAPGDFVDVARIPLAPGPYVLELKVEDLGDVDRPHLEYEFNVEIEEFNALDISDLFMAQGVAAASDPPSSLTRSGRDILPLVDSRISNDAEHVLVYGEMYGTDGMFGPGSAFLVTAGFKAPGDPQGWVEETRRFFRQTAAPVIPWLESIPVPPPGRYDLVVEVMTPQQELVVARSLAVECISSEVQDAAQVAHVLSPFVLLYDDRDSLLSLVETLWPIADAGERRSIEFVLQGADLRQLQSFLDQFWIARAPEDPESAWREYRKEVAVADGEFGNCPNREGHETDMGWILLRYGRPNTIVKRHHGTQYYPYEIWHYHKAGTFNNRRFLFYAPQVVGECFELLHSDHPRELSNADWLDILRTRELGHSVARTAEHQLGRRDTYSREEPEDLFFNPR